MGLNERARELVDAMKTTAEFAELKQAKSVIDKNSKLKNELELFYKRQGELYSGKISPKEAESRMAELNKKFEELSRIPEVDKYLKASKRFNDMAAKVYKAVNDSIDSELKSR